jgi:hypothetical protein
MVDRMAAQLPTWRSRLMQKPGRLAFVKSVLGAIPIHQLLVLRPSKKILKQLGSIESGFLWEGRAAANGGSCHVHRQRSGSSVRLMCWTSCQSCRYWLTSCTPSTPWMSLTQLFSCRPASTVLFLLLGMHSYSSGAISLNQESVGPSVFPEEGLCSVSNAPLWMNGTFHPHRP